MWWYEVGSGSSLWPWALAAIAAIIIYCLEGTRAAKTKIIIWTTYTFPRWSDARQLVRLMVNRLRKASIDLNLTMISYSCNKMMVKYWLRIGFRRSNSSWLPSKWAFPFVQIPARLKRRIDTAMQAWSCSKALNNRMKMFRQSRSYMQVGRGARPQTTTKRQVRVPTSLVTIWSYYASNCNNLQLFTNSIKEWSSECCVTVVTKNSPSTNR